MIVTLRRRGLDILSRKYRLVYIYYHTQLAKMSFDKIFDLTAGV